MKLKIKQIGLGLINAQNNDVMIVGGMRSGNSDASTTRRRYVVYDKKLWLSLEKQNDPNNTEDYIEKQCNMGFVDLFVKDGKESSFGVEGLVNIEIKKEHRRKGMAGKVIQAIRETTGSELKIYDIKKHVASVWRKLGVTEFQNSHGKPVLVSKVAASLLINGIMPALEPTLKKSPPKKSVEPDRDFSM